MKKMLLSLLVCGTVAHCMESKDNALALKMQTVIADKDCAQFVCSDYKSNSQYIGIDTVETAIKQAGKQLDKQKFILFIHNQITEDRTRESVYPVQKYELANKKFTPMNDFHFYPFGDESCIQQKGCALVVYYVNKKALEVPTLTHDIRMNRLWSEHLSYKLPILFVLDELVHASILSVASSLMECVRDMVNRRKAVPEPECVLF